MQAVDRKESGKSMTEIMGDLLEYKLVSENAMSHAFEQFQQTFWDIYGQSGATRYSTSSADQELFKILPRATARDK